jgi:hypothetical protein
MRLTWRLKERPRRRSLKISKLQLAALSWELSRRRKRVKKILKISNFSKYSKKSEKCNKRKARRSEKKGTQTTTPILTTRKKSYRRRKCMNSQAWWCNLCNKRLKEHWAQTRNQRGKKYKSNNRKSSKERRTSWR